MAKAPDFKRLLAHPIKPIGGPQMLLDPRGRRQIHQSHGALAAGETLLGSLLRAPSRLPCAEKTGCDMPREGAIIFRDLVAKLDVLNIECDNFSCATGAPPQHSKPSF